MRLKTNLHFHTSEDWGHTIPYTIKEGVDKASELGFDVLAITCHREFLCTQEHIEYAATKGVLLIPGIEADIRRDNKDRGRHTIILNCKKDIEKVRTFDELAEYKKNNPEIFILAPHPYFYGGFSLHEHLIPNLKLFDAIEHSWFYSKFFNRNKKADKIAKENNIPFISTSDTHFFDFFNKHYAIVDAEEKTIESVFKAIKNHKFENVASYRKPFTEMLWKFGMFMLIDEVKKLFRGKKR